MHVPTMSMSKVACAIWRNYRDSLSHQVMRTPDPKVWFRRGLRVSFDVAGNFWGLEKDGTQSPYREHGVRQVVSFLFFGYTTVMMRVHNSDSAATGTLHEWNMIASHDSCWTDIDGNIHEVFRHLDSQVHAGANIPESEWENYEVSWHMSPLSMWEPFFSTLWIASHFDTDGQCILDHLRSDHDMERLVAV